MQEVRGAGELQSLHGIDMCVDIAEGQHGPPRDQGNGKSQQVLIDKHSESDKIGADAVRPESSHTCRQDAV